MKKIKIILTSSLLCFALLLQFSFISADTKPVSITKSDSTAASASHSRPVSRTVWYYANSGATSTGYLTTTCQQNVNGSWQRHPVSAYIRTVAPNSSTTMNGIDTDWIVRLHLNGSKQCTGSGYIEGIH